MDSAADVERVLSFLNDSELNSIPAEITSKVEANFGNRLTESGQKLQRLQIDLEEATLELQSSQDRLRSLESAESSLSQENASLRASIAELQVAKTNMELELGDTENNRQTLSALLEKKESELSTARDEMNSMKERHEQVSKELSDTRVRCVDIEAAQSMLQAQLSRKDAECEQLTQERYALDAEKLEYMRTISRLQMEKSAEVSNHHHSVETIKNDLTNTQQLLETYKQQTQQLTEKLRQEQARHRECRDNFIASEESHRQELSSQKKLTALYKEAEQKAASELEDIHKTASEYKEGLERLTTEYEESMAQKQAKLEEVNSILLAKEAHIEQIESELARMNELMKESAESPDVTAELAKLIKSGLTYSQLYHKYHQTAEQLTLSKAENTRLNDCFNALVKEIDVMKPQVVQLRTAHEASSSMVQKLSEQLKHNLQNLDEEARKASEAKKQCTHYQKECNKYTLENEDLATQVQILTKEVHLAKGGRIIADDSSAQVSSSTSRTSADVISSQLVSFRDIQELQKQNQQLRAVLRELSEHQEKVENSEHSTRLSAKLEQDLKNTRQEVEHLKQSRLKQEQLVQSIIRQRDMYKELVAQGAMKEAQAKASPKRPITEVDNEKLKSLTDELQSSKDALNRVNDELQKYRSEAAVKESSLREQIEEMRKGLTEQKLTNAKLTTQLDYSLESSKVIEKNVTAYKQEIAALRTKAEQCSNLAAKNESIAASLRQDASLAQESAVKHEVANHQLRNELDLLKTVNRRLQMETDSAKKDYNLQLQMLSNLQSIQASIQDSNAQMKVHYQHRIEQQEKDKTILEKQIESLKEQLLSTEQHHSKESAELSHKIETAEEQLNAAKQKLVATLEEQKLHRQASTSRAGDRSVAGQDDSSQQQDVGETQDLQHAKSEITALKDQLRLGEEATDEYRTAADRLELTLREQTAASQQLKKTLESRIAELENDVGRLSGREKELTQQYDALFELKSNLDAEFTQTKGCLTAELTEVKANLSVYKQKLESKEQVEAKARADLVQASNLNEELANKYQAELDRAIKLSEENTEVKKEKESLSNRVNELENDILRLELQMQANHASFEAHEAEYKNSLQSLQQELTDGKEQSKRLHEQLEYLSHKSVGESSAQSSDTEAISEEQNTARLFELVKVLRKDKELYETRSEVATAETKRLQAKVTFTEGELKLARAELSGERSQASIDIQTKAQHAELLRKVEQINVLTDSNRMLRQEKDAMQPRIDSLEQQVTTMLVTAEQIESKSRELSATVQTLQAEKASLHKTVEHFKQRSVSQAEKFNREKADEVKRHVNEMEQARKNHTVATQHVSRLNAELAKLKATLATTEEEKVKATNQVEEVKGNLTAAETQIASFKEDMRKKDHTIGELKKLGRKYRANYTKLLEEGKGAASSETAQSDDGKGAASGSAQTTSADETTAKLQSEVNTMKETITAQTEEISRLKTQIEELQAKVADAERQLAQAQQELTAEKEKNSKVSSELEEVTSKHTTLKEFVGNSLRPKIKAQKEDLERKQKELVAVQAENSQLMTQLEDMQNNLDESKAKLMSLLEEKSSGGTTSSQSNHPANSTDGKRSQVRTIEVRPMAQQQPKQLTATVMPTTSQNEAQESEEPMVGIVSPTSIASPNTSNAAGPSTSVVSAMTAGSADTLLMVQPSTQSATSSTPVASAAPIVSVTAGAATISSMQSVVPQATLTSVVSPQVGVVASQSSDVPLASTSGLPSSTSSAAVMPRNISHSPNATVASSASTAIPAAAVTAQTSAHAQEVQREGSILPEPSAPSSSGAYGEGASGSNEAEVSRGKRSREDEADDNEPTVKRTRDDESLVEEVDDVSSQEADVEQLDSGERAPAAAADQQTLPTSSLMQAEQSPAHDIPSDQEEPTESAAVGEEVMPGEFDEEPAHHIGHSDGGYSPPASHSQEPTYSGADADVVIIVSSDEDEDAVDDQTDAVEAEDMEDPESDLDDVAGGEESPRYESEEDTQEDEVDEQDYEEGEVEDVDVEGVDDDDGSDIIMIEEPSSATGAASTSVSSSQPSSRRMASLAAFNYQAQGTVSMDSNVNDDGIVPSTPTLALPVSLSRSDGFAVAVSSPNPSQEPFAFGSSAVPSAGFADLAQQAIVMDDLPQIGDSHNEVDGSSIDPSAASTSTFLPVGSSSVVDPARSDMDSQQMPTESSAADLDLPCASTSSPDPGANSTSSMEMPSESISVVQAPTESSSAGPSSTDARTATTSTDLSNVVSTDSTDNYASGSQRATEEMVSSSEANAGSQQMEPVVSSDANQSGQPDMPSSSSQARPATARRGRVRLSRLNRPTFNKPK